MLTPTAPPTEIRTVTELPPSLAALASHSQQVRFEHLPPDKGLSQSVVTDFVQDDLGFLWLATQEWLNRYDGYNFKIFKEDPALPNGLKGNFIAAIDKGAGGEIWIGTADGGLNRYDPQTDQFTTPINHKKAIPAYGPILRANVIVFALVSSHTALVVRSLGIVIRIRTMLAE